MSCARNHGSGYSSGLSKATVIEGRQVCGELKSFDEGGFPKTERGSFRVTQCFLWLKIVFSYFILTSRAGSVVVRWAPRFCKSFDFR